MLVGWLKRQWECLAYSVCYRRIRELVKPKPGFKPLPAGSKGVTIGGVGGVCTAVLQSGDFILGLMCAMLLIGIGVINNRE